MLPDIYDASEPSPPPSPPAVGSVPFDEFVAELLQLYHPSLRSKSTRRQILHSIGILRELGVVSTSDLTVTLIAKMVSTRDPALSPNSVRSLLRSVQSICSHAAKCGVLAVSPFTIRPLRTWVRASAPQGTSHLSREEIRRLLDLLRHDSEEKLGWARWRARRLEALVNVVAYTGLRLSEATHLHVSDIDLTESVIYVVERSIRLKTSGSSVPVPIAPPLGERLADWLAHIGDAPPRRLRPPSPWCFPNSQAPTPWTGGVSELTPLGRLRAIGTRAGVPHATFQRLRRSVATHLEFSGAGPAMIQRILRHTSMQTSVKYYRKADIANMRAAMEHFTY